MVSGNLRLKTQTAPLYIFAQFEAGNIETANAVAAVLALLSFTLFYLLLRFTGCQKAWRLARACRLKSGHPVKAYGDLVVVYKVSFIIEEGELFVLLGGKR